MGSGISVSMEMTVVSLLAHPPVGLDWFAAFCWKFLSRVLFAPGRAFQRILMKPTVPVAGGVVGSAAHRTIVELQSRQHYFWE